MLGDRVARRTWVAMAVAVAGVTLMVGGPGRPSALGLALSLVMSVSFAATLVLTRHRRDVSMAPAMCLSQVAVFVLAAPFAQPQQAGALDVTLFAMLGIAQIGLGFIFLTIGAPPDPGRRGGADHAARDRARAALGLAVPLRGAERRDASPAA